MSGDGHSVDGEGPEPPAAAVPPVSADLVETQLRSLGWTATGVSEIGAGHWSVCFGFASDKRPLVVRYGHHRDDFDKDRAAHRFASPGLPIPEVLEIGRAFMGRDLGGPSADGPESGCWYAISDRADGIPLELTTPERWDSVVPAVVDALEGMRTAPLPDAARWGVWTEVRSGSPIGSHEQWRDYLLESIRSSRSVHDRIPGWEAKLASNRRGVEDFAWGERLLTELLADDELLRSVERGVTHQDMLHGNVHVAADRLTGLFDWGCASYSDHLYDLAMIEFWNPWHPDLDVAELRSALHRRWSEIGFHPRRLEDRLRVCHLHNGLTHLAYVAHLQNWETLTAIGNRMRDLLSDDDEYNKNQRYDKQRGDQGEPQL